MHTGLALIVLVLFPQEKNEAEALFKKMEAKIAAATTVRMKMTGEMVSMKMTLSAEVLFGEGGKTRIDLEGKAGDQVMTARFLSDGKRIRVESSDKAAPKELEAVATLGQRTRAFLARAGTFGVLESIDSVEELKAEPDDLIATSGHKLGAKEKVGDREAQMVEYKVTRKGHRESTATVWIDLETLLPLKRTLTKGEITVSETYAEFKLDEKIDAAKFELPK